MPGTARAAASARRARLDPLVHGHGGDGGVVEPEVQLLGGPRLVGETRRRVLTGGPRHRHRLPHEGVEGGEREIRGVGRRGALAHEHPDAEGLAARFLQGLDLALADRDRELGAFGDQEVGGGSPRPERFPEEVQGEVTRIHVPPVYQSDGPADGGPRCVAYPARVPLGTGFSGTASTGVTPSA